MIRALLVFLGMASLLMASRVVLPIEAVQIAGNQQIKSADIKKNTGLEVGSPWLWAWPYRLNTLKQNPWVLKVHLERPEPGVVRIVLEERKIIAHLESHSQKLGLSADGVLLRNAPQKGPQIANEVDFLTTEMVQVVRAFPYAERIRYDRAGFTVEGRGVKVWGRTASELQKIAKSDTMVGSALRANSTTPAQGSQVGTTSVFVYSWGVSKHR